MSLNGLPLVLETLLAKLLQDMPLISWNINGKSTSTNVILRFGMATNTTDIEGLQVKYKRVKPSQLARDKARATNYNTESNRIGEFDHNDNNVNYKGDPTMQVKKSLACDNEVDQSLYHSPGMKSEINTSGINQVLTDESKPGHEIGLSSSSLSTGQCDPNMHTEYLSLSIKAEQSIDEHGDNDNGDNSAGSCSKCGGCVNLLRNYWYRCTKCSDHDICITCWENGAHKHHQDQVHHFSNPEDTKYGYCESCGYTFIPHGQFMVDQCTKCEDYALCFNCTREEMHSHHKQHMQRVPLQDYLDVIN